jgi:hypothetical protein
LFLFEINVMVGLLCELDTPQTSGDLKPIF